MKAHDVGFLLVIGLIIWVAGTLYFANYGRQILESTSARYWVAFVLSPAISTLLCIAILRWRHVSAAHWTSAMLLLALPGMVGEAVVLSSLSTFLPKLHATSGGRYGALLFATYAIVLGIAEVITLRVTP
jgi:Family of unknown function (DUF5367)